MTRFGSWTVLCCWLAFSSAAYGQGGIRQGLSAETRVAEVGEPFAVTYTVLAEAGGTAPAAPTLAAPAGVTLRGPSVSSQQHVSIVGGQISQSVGISATWVATASRPGRVTFGPATARVGAAVVRSEPLVVEVVPAGQGSGGGNRRRGSNPFGFIDPFGSPFPRMPGFPDPLGAQPEPAREEESPFVPDDFRVEAPAAPIAFLRAVARPRRVVLGEQVTYTVIAYARRMKLMEGSGREPTHPDFTAIPIVETAQAQDLYRVRIGDEIWGAVKVRQLALFPVRTGTLTIAPMTMAFDLGLGRRPLTRSAEPIEITVDEPPLAGRPPGYALGDVGHFTLEAVVEPRELTLGDAVSVELVIRGTGNFPMKLRVPQQTGVTWLPPTESDGITMTDDRPSGWRRLTHVVRLERPGEVDLGEVTLPYWDPSRRAYAVASVQLGTIRVQGTEAPPVAKTESEALADLLAPRGTLAEPARPRMEWGDRWWFWALLAGSPLGVALLGAVANGARHLRRRWAVRSPSERALIARELAAARRAAATGDVATAGGACERALHRALSAVLAVSSRGLLRDELDARFREAGVSEAVGARVAETLEILDSARYAGALEADMAALVARAERLVAELGDVARREGRALQ